MWRERLAKVAAHKKAGRHLVLEAASILQAELKDAAAFQWRLRPKIIGAHNNAHIFDGELQQAVFRRLRVRETQQLKYRPNRRIRPETLAIRPQMEERIAGKLAKLSVKIVVGTLKLRVGTFSGDGQRRRVNATAICLAKWTPCLYRMSQ